MRPEPTPICSRFKELLLYFPIFTVKTMFIMDYLRDFCKQVLVSEHQVDLAAFGEIVSNRFLESQQKRLSFLRYFLVALKLSFQAFA